MFGMNALTLVGFVPMAVGLNLQLRAASARLFAFALMGVGTVLVFAGIYTLHQIG